MRACRNKNLNLSLTDRVKEKMAIQEKLVGQGEIIESQ